MQNPTATRKPAITKQTIEIKKNGPGTVEWRFYDIVSCFYVLEGELSFKTPSKTIWVQKDECLFVFPEVLFNLSSVPDSTTIRIIYFNPDIYCGFNSNKLAETANAIFSRQDLEFFKTNQTSFVGKRFAKWFKTTFSLDSSDEKYEIDLASNSIELLSILTDLTAGKKYRPIKKSKPEVNLTRMVKYIKDHWNEKFTIDDLVGELKIKERQCLRIFQDYLHVSPMQYLMALRLEEATKMLSGSEILSVSQIAENCGFVSSSYFIKVFKRRYGVTPSQYATETTASKKLDNPLEALSDFFG